MNGDVVDKLYMCATDYDLELGFAAGGIEVYSSVEDLKKCRGCVEAECGIYEVEVRLVKVIKKSEI